MSKIHQNMQFPDYKKTHKVSGRGLSPSPEDLKIKLLVHL